MDESVELLLLSSVMHPCADCDGLRIFVTVEGSRHDSGEHCCTECGAAIIIDPVFVAPLVRRKVA